jgi:hypothetical protein
VKIGQRIAMEKARVFADPEEIDASSTKIADDH